MISRNEVLSIFEQHLPPEVTVRFADKSIFMTKARFHPFIMLQIEMGIYSLDNIDDDFLSPAVAYVEENLLDVCYDIIEQQAEGVPDALTRAYVTDVALHEAHHFQERQSPRTAIEHAFAELDTTTHQHNKDPELQAQVDEFCKASPVYQRVLTRVAGLKR